MEEIIGNIRQFDLTLKAEHTVDSVLKTLDVDCYKPEAMENLLGVLSHVIQGSLFYFPAYVSQPMSLKR